MMMYALSLVAFAFLAVRLLVALINLLTPVRLHKGQPAQESLVSVAVPARNEEENIANLLDTLLTQDYQQIEILVYDDQSEDATGEILRDYQQKDERVQYLRGENLPQGWKGKNHACYQLARHAKGSYILFLDADITVHDGLIKNSLAYLQKHKLHLLSLFPTQKMQSVGEYLTVPLMNWILLSLLPLLLVRLSKRPSLAAANGQFMLFPRESYKAQQWHQTMRASAVEDIQISRALKKKGLPTQTLLGDKYISCRMYSGFGAAIQGFTKNVLHFFGGSWLFLLFFLFTTSAGLFLSYAYLHPAAFWAYAAMALALRGVVAAQSRQNPWLVALLAPLQQLSFVWLAIQTAFLSFARKGQWKGRPLH